MSQRETTDVVVVGSGPNGLAAALTMARAGLEVQVFEAQSTIGGGARTLDLELEGHLRHDVCSAVHPMAAASPFFTEFDLPARGVELIAPDLAYAQPLDAAPAGLAYRDLERTVAGLGVDGPAWRQLLGPLVAREEAVLGVALGDRRSIPQQARSIDGMRGAVQFGLRTLEQGSPTWNRRFAERAAPALLTGVAVHGNTKVPSLATSGLALMLATLAHTVGWTIPLGGSQSIIDAMVRDLRAHGGSVRTGMPVTDHRQLPRARAYFFDTAPRTLAQVWGERLPATMAHRFKSFRHGNAAAKVDFVLSGPVPWRDVEVSGAGTVHVGGTREQMADAEAQVAAGQHATQPVVLVSDPTVADPGRSQGGLRPLWTYTHVPHGSTRDVTEAITAQIERFAPGFRDVVVDSRSVPAERMQHENANLIGGDIGGGVINMDRILIGPARRWDPFASGIPGVYLCSSSVPPASGVHGMSGYYAARRALKARFGRPVPSLAPAD